jgi:AP-4 complex subunit mu-1
MDFLRELIWVIEDFCGPISEKVIRKDLILIYEVIDEYFDFGYAGVTSTDEMSRHIDY